MVLLDSWLKLRGNSVVVKKSSPLPSLVLGKNVLDDADGVTNVLTSMLNSRLEVSGNSLVNTILPLLPSVTLGKGVIDGDSEKISRLEVSPLPSMTVFSSAALDVGVG